MKRPAREVVQPYQPAVASTSAATAPISSALAPVAAPWPVARRLGLGGRGIGGGRPAGNLGLGDRPSRGRLGSLKRSGNIVAGLGNGSEAHRPRPLSGHRPAHPDEAVRGYP